MSEERSFLGSVWDTLVDLADMAVPDALTTTFNAQNTAAGNDLAQSKYDFRYKVFPDDLGMDDNGHYMVININVPTKFSTAKLANPLYTGDPVAGAFGNFVSPLNQVSKVDTLRYGQNITGGVQAPTGLNIPRFSKRIAESVALYMPSSLIYNHHNIYEEISLTALAGKLTVGGVNLGVKFLLDKAGIPGRYSAPASAGTGKIQDAFGNALSGTSSLLQSPINPMVEVLFTNTPQRQFVFEVLMAPRNEKESETIRSIVQTLRFHATPELNDFALNGLFWIPPADFDITFFNKGQENTNILRINTCVMERIEVDYSPSGVYSTFRNGHPVAVRLSMAFRELEPLHKQRIIQGF